MKTAEDMRRDEAERTIRDLKLRVTRLEHQVANLLIRLEKFLEEE